MKLITNRIRRLEDELVQTRKALADPGLHPEMRANAVQCRDSLLILIDAEMAASPESIERDTIPSEVAAEMLCEPRARMTNRMRKNCLAARETHYASVLTRTPGATKLAARLHTAKLTQLGSWLRRSVSRGRTTSRLRQRLDGITGLEKLLQLVTIRGINLAISQAAIETELQARHIPYVVRPAKPNQSDVRKARELPAKPNMLRRLLNLFGAK